MTEEQPDDPAASALQRLTEAAPESIAAGVGGVGGLAIGAFLDGPAGAFAGAYIGNASGPLIEAAGRGLATMARTRFANSLAPLAIAGQQLNTDPADVITRATADPRHLELMTRAMEAAGRTPSDGPTELQDKLRALGRVLASALDGTETIDTALLIASALHDLEAPHVRALRIIEDLDTLRPNPQGWASKTPGVSVREMRVGLRGQDGALEAVIGTLTRHGLVRDAAAGAFGGGEARYAVTDLGTELLDLLTDHAPND